MCCRVERENREGREGRDREGDGGDLVVVQVQLLHIVLHSGPNQVRKRGYLAHKIPPPPRLLP